jgi:hypothetical protein
MATTAAPYGLKPVKRADGMPYAGATSQYLIDPAGAGYKPFLRPSRSHWWPMGTSHFQLLLVPMAQLTHSQLVQL